MSRLVPVPDPTGRDGAASLWINPDHITSLRPIVDEVSEVWRLHVELKLQGMPLERLLIAQGERADVDAAWSRFLDELAGASG